MFACLNDYRLKLTPPRISCINFTHLRGLVTSLMIMLFWLTININLYFVYSYGTVEFLLTSFVLNFFDEL